MADLPKLDRFCRDQLRSIGSGIYGDGRPYWWGKKSMPKLAAHGLVEPHPTANGAWRITDKGRAALTTAQGGDQ